MSFGIHPITASRKIYFVLSARDLPIKIRGATGVATVPDPFVKIYHKDNSNSEWQELVKTKHVIDSVNPDWLEVVSFDWKRETGQKWRVEVLDFDVLSKNDVIDSFEVDVDNFVLIKREELTTKLKNGGLLVIKKTIPIHFRLQVEDLPKLDTGSGSDPFVECYWSFGPEGETHLFHKTKTIDNAQNARWEETVTFESHQPGTNQHFTLKVYDKDVLKHDVIGQVSFEVDSYVKSGKTGVHRLFNDKDTRGKATISVIPVNN
jgi:Ca2+-dependent lipid-binding protein